LIDSAEPDHYQARQDGQRHPLRGAGLHPGRAGNRFGTGIEADWMFGLRKHCRVPVVGDGNRQRTTPLCLAQAGEGERGVATRRDGDQHIAFVDPVPLHQSGAVIDVVFGAFDRMQ
jgi:hypothetical protein